MTTKFVKFALSIAAVSPLLFSAFAPANAQAPATQMQKPGAHITKQETHKTANATKPKKPTNVATKSTRPVSYSSQKDPILRLGSRGKAVRELQASLKKQNLYNGVANGIYDKNTRSAIIAFQKSHNLKADGVVGAKTWSAIH